MTGEVTTPPRLEYAPGAPLRRRRRVRQAVLLILLAGAALAGWMYGPRAWARAALLYAQHRCLTYAPPPDQIVYESADPGKEELLTRPGYVALPTTGGPWGSGPAATVAGFRPPPLADLEGRVGAPLTGGPAAVLFLHELRHAPTGRRLLVVVSRGASTWGPITSPFDLQAIVFDVATIRTDLRVTTKSDLLMWAYSGPGFDLPTTGLRFYAGQVDPGDPSRFTIRYALEGREGLIDGRLNAAGDDVELAIRTGPAAPPSPWSSPLPPHRLSAPAGRR
jgi:hypothetical protein